MRVTKSLLREMVENINRLSNRRYDLDCSYGGYRLVVECEGGGVADVSWRTSGREMMYILDAIYSYAMREVR